MKKIIGIFVLAMMLNGCVTTQSKPPEPVAAANVSQSETNKGALDALLLIIDVGTDIIFLHHILP